MKEKLQHFQVTSYAIIMALSLLAVVLVSWKTLEKMKNGEICIEEE